MSSTSAVSSAASTVSTAASSTTSSDNTISTDDFLKILVAEMSNQDPTNPMDDTAVITQMAQFNTLEQMTNLNESVSSLLIIQASSLIGKSVTATVDGSTIAGTVTSITVADSVPYAVIGENSVPVSSIATISNET
jgi:Flagellar hook capping protein